MYVSFSANIHAFYGMQRITAKDALDAEYFWTDPLPCSPSRYGTRCMLPK